MTRIRPFLILLLTLLPLFAAQAQDAPPQFALALADLGSRLNRPITLNDLDAWNYEQNLYSDTAFGCQYVAGEPRPNGISAFTFTFAYQNHTYDYRVAADGSLTFPCDPSMPQGTAATPTPTNCPAGFVGYLPPKLEVGGYGRIGTGGTPNRLRDQPSVNGTQIGLIQPGTTIEIIDGPFCEDQSHIIWWRVDDHGTQGWTAEGQLPNNYFLSPSAATLPAERDLITPDTADTLVPLTSISLAGVRSISIPREQKWIALGGQSGLAVYDLATLNLVANLGDISAPVTAVAFSPDARWLAYATQNGRLTVIDTQTQARTYLIETGSSRINGLAFDSNGNLIAGTGSPTGGASGWEEFALPGGNSLLKPAAESWVRGVGFSPDGTLFAWVDTTLHVVQLPGGAALGTFALQTPGNGGLAWRPSPAGVQPTRQIAFTDGTRVRLENLDTKAEQVYEDDASFTPGAVAFNSDGTLLAAMSIADNPATGSLVNLFAADTGDLIASTPLKASSAMTFSPDGTLLVIAAYDEVLFLGVDNLQIAVG
jgi:hypothetical protein